MTPKMRFIVLMLVALAIFVLFFTDFLQTV